CGCELASACQAVFPFTLLGGQQTIALGTNFYTYSATRVVLDACLEPEPDPVREGIKCTDVTSPLGPVQRYLPSGVDVKLLVATGFPGVAIGTSAFARLRGDAAVAAAMASPQMLYLPDTPGGMLVGSATLGGTGLSALAL